MKNLIILFFIISVKSVFSQTISGVLTSDGLFYYLDDDKHYQIDGEYSYVKDLYDTNKVDYYLENTKLFVKNKYRYEKIKLLVVYSDGDSEIINISAKKKHLSKKTHRTLQKNQIKINVKGLVDNNNQNTSLIFRTIYDNDKILANIGKKNDDHPNVFFKYEKNYLKNPLTFEYKKDQEILKSNNYFFISKKFEEHLLGYKFFYLNELHMLQYKLGNQISISSYYNNNENNIDIQTKYSDNVYGSQLETKIDSYNNFADNNYYLSVNKYTSKKFFNNWGFLFDKQSVYKNFFENKSYSLNKTDLGVFLKSTLIDTNHHYLYNFMKFENNYNNFYNQKKYSDNITYMYKTDNFILDYTTSYASDNNFITQSLKYQSNIDDTLLFLAKFDYTQDYYLSNLSVRKKWDRFSSLLGTDIRKYKNGITNDSIYIYNNFSINDQWIYENNLKLGLLNKEKNNLVFNNSFIYKRNENRFKFGYQYIENYSFNNYDHKWYLNYDFELYSKNNIDVIFSKKQTKKIKLYIDSNYNGLFDDGDIPFIDSNLQFVIKHANKGTLHHDRKIINDLFEITYDSYDYEKEELLIDGLPNYSKTTNISLKNNYIEIGIQKYEKMKIKTKLNDAILNTNIEYDLECDSAINKVNHSGYIYETMVKNIKTCKINNLSNLNIEQNFEFGAIDYNHDEIVINLIPRNKLMIYVSLSSYDYKDPFFIIVDSKKKIKFNNEVIIIDDKNKFKKDFIELKLLYNQKRFLCVSDYTKVSIDNQNSKTYKIEFFCKNK